MNAIQIPKAVARAAWFARDRARFRSYARTSDLPIVLCYSMGKAGSTSIFKTLKSTKYANGAQHIHFLNSDTLPEMQKLHEEAGFRLGPAHLQASQNFLREKQHIESGRLKIVMAMRDPVAFAISNLFQNPYFFNDFSLDLHDSNQAEIESYILSSVVIPGAHSFRYWENWFSKELESVFGFSFNDVPFDKERGWSVVDADGAAVGCIQLEALTQGFSALTEELVGEPLKLAKQISNQRASKNDFYKRIVDNIRVPADTLNDIYSSKYVSTFYSDIQIDKFKERWS